MAAGLSAGTSVLNNTIGNAVLSLAQAVAQCNAVNTMLNDAARFGGQAGLVAAGYTSGDATLIMNSFGDLANLYKVAHGQQATGASDFFFNAKLLLGTVPMPL